jgi:integrase
MAGLEVKERNGIFYATGTIAGQRVRKSLGTRIKRQAEELAAQYEATLWKRHTYGEGAVRTFEEAAVSYLEAGHDARFTVPLIRRFRGRVLGSITPEEIRQAARTIYPSAKASTLNRQGIAPARAIINHGAALSWCSPIKVKNFPVEKVRRRSVGREWIDEFLAQADRDKLPHVAAAVLFMWQNAPRVSEVIGVLPEHVDLQARVIWLETTKTDSWEPCHITRELMLRLANLPMTDGAPVFGYRDRFGISRRMRAVCRKNRVRAAPSGGQAFLCDKRARYGRDDEGSHGGRAVEIGSPRAGNLCPCRAWRAGYCRPF